MCIIIKAYPGMAGYPQFDPTFPVCLFIRQVRKRNIPRIKMTPENDDSDFLSIAREGRIPAIEPLFVYGVKPDVRGGLYFAADNVTLLYPAGCGIAQFDSKVFTCICSLWSS